MTHRDVLACVQLHLQHAVKYAGLDIRYPPTIKHGMVIENGQCRVDIYVDDWENLVIKSRYKTMITLSNASCGSLKFKRPPTHITLDLADPDLLDLVVAHVRANLLNEE